MRILKVVLENFGSYKELNFDFKNQGLTLIEGATGSGKSTLCDAIPWVLYGRTAKGGAVDEVLSWPGHKITSGRIVLESNVHIVRIRGPKAKDNDLYIDEENGARRGKDLNDTQKLINSLLGCTYDTYIAGCYFHEFSQTAQFFTTLAKNRRQICEQIVDLSLASRLQEKTTTEIKSIKTLKSIQEKNIIEAETKLRTLERVQLSENTKVKNWEKQHAESLHKWVVQSEQFELKRQSQIEDLVKLLKADLETLKTTTICSECGQEKVCDPNAVSIYEDKIKQKQAEVNTYLIKLEHTKLEKNPYTGDANNYKNEIDALIAQLEYLSTENNRYNENIDLLQSLNSILIEFRSLLIQNTINRVEESTNNYLETYFNGEMRIKLLVDELDKLEVEITKDNNSCAYTQLSKGQRCMLKLAFGASVMQEVSNHNGISFNCAFFDETLDGCDDQVKMQAIKLLEHLTQIYGTVFFVEHSETVKTFVDNKYTVELVEGRSEVRIK